MNGHIEKVRDLSKKAKIAHMIAVGHFSGLPPTQTYLDASCDEFDQLALEWMERCVESDDERLDDVALQALEEGDVNAATKWMNKHPKSADLWGEAEKQYIDSVVLPSWGKTGFKQEMRETRAQARILARELYDQKNAALEGEEITEYHKVGESVFPFYGAPNLHGKAIETVPDEALIREIDLNSFERLEDGGDRLDMLFDEVIEALQSNVSLNKEEILHAYRELLVFVSNKQDLAESRRLEGEDRLYAEEEEAEEYAPCLTMR